MKSMNILSRMISLRQTYKWDFACRIWTAGLYLFFNICVISLYCSSNSFFYHCLSCWNRDRALIKDSAIFFLQAGQLELQTIEMVIIRKR